jgi:two-component system response regulator HydG
MTKLDSPGMPLHGADCTLLEQALDLLPSGVFFVDRECRIQAWNRQMTEITGFGFEEVAGQHCSVLMGDQCFSAPDRKGDPRSSTCALFRGCSIQGKRCQVRRKDGTWVHVVKNARLFYDASGGVSGGVETVTDITQVLGLEEELNRLRRVSTERAATSDFYGYVGRHPSMQRLYDLLATAGPSDSAVLIQGETGSGKGVAARAIHEMSPRKDKPFVRVSCTALSESLLESELFGHVRGAFTGAVSGRKGRFEAADGGTLFLDEIGDVSPRVQTKLLRVLEELAFERVGSNRSIQVDVRVVAATHRDLQAMCDEGSFRPDLYFRLAVIPIRIPPLRERSEDVPLLVDHFLHLVSSRMEIQNPGIEAEAMELLIQYGWPGNVRELLHAIEYSIVIAGSRPIGAAHLPPAIQSAVRYAREGRSAPRAFSGMARQPPRKPGGRRSRSRPSREQILAALEEVDGVRAQAAEVLGVSRMTLWKWMRDLEIEWPPIPGR